jgi:hypothetical protein
VVDVELADSMPDGWELWLNWQKFIAPDNQVEIEAIEADQGNNLGYVRAVARRRDNVSLEDPLISIPSEYKKRKLLRDELS